MEEPPHPKKSESKDRNEKGVSRKGAKPAKKATPFCLKTGFKDFFLRPLRLA